MSYFLDRDRVKNIESWAKHCEHMNRREIYRTVLKSFFTRGGLLDLVISMPGMFGIMLIIFGLFGKPLLIILGISFLFMGMFYFATEVALLVHVNKEKSKTNGS